MRSFLYFVLRKLRHWILIVDIDPVWFGANKQFNRNNEFMNRQTNRVLLHSTQSSSDLTDNKSNQLFFLNSIDLFSLRLLYVRERIFFYILWNKTNQWTQLLIILTDLLLQHFSRKEKRLILTKIPFFSSKKVSVFRLFSFFKLWCWLFRSDGRSSRHQSHFGNTLWRGRGLLVTSSPLWLENEVLLSQNSSCFSENGYLLLFASSTSSAHDFQNKSVNSMLVLDHIFGE